MGRRSRVYDLMEEAMLVMGRAPVRYLLLDRFITDRAAGAVDGTAPEPGPGGARVVTDTNSKLSIVNGVLSFATGGAGAGNPGLWYATTPGRVLGKTILCDVNVAAAGIEIGFDTDQASNIQNAIIFTGGGNLSFRNVSLTAATGVYSTGVDYKVAIVQRVSGIGIYIKGGAFANWSLLMIGDSQMSANVFPGLSVTTTTAVLVADNLRIPDRLFIFAPLASDSFNRADGPLGSTDGAGHAEANGGGGLAWAGDTWSISGNAAINTPTLGADVIVNGDFDTDTDWTKGAGWTISGGTGVATTVAGTDLSQTVAPLTVGVWYRVTYDITRTGGSVRLVAGGNQGPLFSANESGITETFRAGSTSIAFRGISSFSGTVDNVTSKSCTLSELFSSIVLSTPEVLAEVAITHNQNYMRQTGMVLCLDSAASGNFILVYMNSISTGGNIIIDKCVAGTYTNLQTTPITYSAGAVLRVITYLSGGALKVRVYYNNALVGSEQSISDAGIISNVRFGKFSTYEGNRLDNFVVWARGANGEYSQLNFS